MDLLIMKALSERQRYDSLKDYVPQDMVTPETRAMLGWYQVYFSAYPEHRKVDPDALKTLIQLRSPTAAPESMSITMHLCEQLKTPANDEAIKGVLGTLYELDFAGRAGAVLAAYDRGEDVDVVHDLEVMARHAKQARANGRSSDYITTDIGEILSSISEDKGIKFRRNPYLYESVAALQGGASVALAAFVDAGKTSLAADTLVDFAPQCAKFFGEDRPILWMNNEGSGKRIVPRVYQSALGATLPEIIALSNQGLLVDRYAEAIEAPPDYIRVKDIHGSSMAQIEQVMEDMRPSVAVVDMMANVKMHLGKGASKTDSVEAAWQEWRELLVRFDCIGIGTIQLSVEGTNMLYPPLTALKDTKIGAQGAMDVAVVMGNLLKPELRFIRGISTPKNKFSIAGKPGYAVGECQFDPDRCLFKFGEPSGVPKQEVSQLASMVG